MKSRLGGRCGDYFGRGYLVFVELLAGSALRVRVLPLVLVSGLAWSKACHLFVIPVRVASVGLER
jgi:hypothetical protein